jgi:hypothetical protein
MLTSAARRPDITAGFLRKQALRLICTSAVLISLGAQPANGQARATLTGEHLTGPADLPKTFNCPGPISFDVGAGVALGPYPGTFTESLTSAGLPSFQATFKIVSGATTITGTKTSSQASSSSCNPLLGTATFIGSFTYQAKIQTASGSFTDQGTGSMSWGTDTRFGGGVEQDFVSSAPPPQACKPGNGYGDKNHCHSGPPGQQSKHP